MKHWSTLGLVLSLACQRQPIPEQQILTPDLVLGGPDAEWQYVASVSTDDAGRIFVADQSGAAVYAYTANGQFLRTIGRRGGGPGEFEYLYGWIPFNSGYAALDAGNGRIQLYDAHWQPTASLKWRGDRGSPATVRFLIASRSEIYVPAMTGSGRTPEYWLARVDSETVTDVFRGYEIEPGDKMRCTTPPDGLWQLEVPLSRRRFTVPAPGHAFALAWSDRYAVSIVSVRGDTIRTVGGQREPAPISTADWNRENSLYRQFRDYYKSAASCQPSDMPRPRYWPAITGLFFDEAGDLYVESRRSRGSHWEVFGRDGRLKRAFATPARDLGVAPWFTTNAAYIVVQDSDNIQWVHRYTVMH